MLNLLLCITILTSAQLPPIPGVGQPCIDGLQAMLGGLGDPAGTTDLGKMLRFSGGKLNDLGDYDNCNKLDGTEYGLALLPSPIPIAYSICGPAACNETEYIQLLLFLMSQNTINQAEEYSQAFRLEAFGSRDIQALAKRVNKLKAKDALTGIEVIFPQNYIEEHFSEFGSGQVAMSLVLGLLSALCLAGTAWDIWNVYFVQPFKEDEDIAIQMTKVLTSSQDPSRGEALLSGAGRSQPRHLPKHIQILQCFSIYTNISKLFTSRATDQNSDGNPLDILNAVRVMSMGWVILGHVYLLRSLSFVQNFQDIVEYYGYKSTALVYGSFYAVDTFFWMSGFLMAYLFISQYQTRGKMHYPLVYVHRLLRILPVYMFTFFFLWAFQRYLGDGPFWFNGDMWNNHCKRYWWTNLFFLNNFIPHGQGNYCMAWSWYLANDMQFFIVTPAVLYIYHKKSKRIGWGILGGFVLLHIMSSMLIASHYDFYVAGDNESDSKSQQFDLYEKPYCRCGAYAIGLACGLVFFANEYWKREKKGYDNIASLVAKVIHTKIWRWLMYFVGITLINVFIFVQRSAYKELGSVGHDTWTQGQRNLWYGFSRIGFILGLSCILLPMLLGHGSLVRKFMQSSVWNPLAKLSFSCYLIHFSVLWTLFWSQRQAYYLHDTFIWMDIVTCLVGSYIAALIPYLLAEAPAMGLERILMGRH